MSITTLLVPTDFSENARAAFSKACEVARLLGAKIYLLHVRDESALRTAIKEGLLEEHSTDKELHEAVERLTEERFTKLLAEVDASGIEVEHVSKRGDADAVIIDYAKSVNADVIVIGRRGAGFMNKIRSAVVGSVTESIIGKSPCPVLVVRRDHVRQGNAGRGE
jgi:nucleotide-binding universal stress UspA family protein